MIEIICQEVERGNSVLACAASNIAVDNIVSRLARLNYFHRNVVRLGHPARLLPEVRMSCIIVCALGIGAGQLFGSTCQEIRQQYTCQRHPERDEDTQHSLVETGILESCRTESNQKALRFKCVTW